MACRFEGRDVVGEDGRVVPDVEAVADLRPADDVVLEALVGRARLEPVEKQHSIEHSRTMTLSRGRRVWWGACTGMPGCRWRPLGTPPRRSPPPGSRTGSWSRRVNPLSHPRRGSHRTGSCRASRSGRRRRCRSPGCRGSTASPLLGGDTHHLGVRGRQSWPPLVVRLPSIREKLNSDGPRAYWSGGTRE